MLAWFRDHPTVTYGVLAGLTFGVMQVVWDVISTFIPPMVPHPNFIGRSLLAFPAIYLVITTANRRGILRRPPDG
jgi:hypothetical protein